MSTRDDMSKALSDMQGAPFFDRFVKTLEARRADIVDKLVGTNSPTEVDVLRGEVRGYDYILKAAKSKI